MHNPYIVFFAWLIVVGIILYVIRRIEWIDNTIKLFISAGIVILTVLWVAGVLPGCSTPLHLG